MTRTAATLAVLAACAMPALAQRGANDAAPANRADAKGVWNVDTKLSQVNFVVQHMVVNRVRGKFTAFDGSINAEPANLAKSTVTFTVKTASVDTGNTGRDDHLRNADFFDAPKYPDMTFTSTKVVRKGDSYIATGNLSMHGITKPITFPFTVTGPVKGQQGDLRAGMNAKFPISRKSYGLTWNRIIEGTGVAVGDTVDIELDLVFVKTK
ncbi:MAG: YceI family protein [Armatimonadaceae bacterium]|jgi:polyisoprenoid-binding protein YceI